MGRRLSEAERGARLVGKPHIRKLSRRGKCQHCKGAIQSGQPSLRYFDLVYSRKQEVGLCMPCARRLWTHAEDAVGRISNEMEKYQEEAEDEADSAQPRLAPAQSASVEQSSAAPVVVQTPQSFIPAGSSHGAYQSPMAKALADPQNADLPEDAREAMAQLDRTRRELMAQMCGHL